MDDTSIFSANNHLDYSIEDIVLKYSKTVSYTHLTLPTS